MSAIQKSRAKIRYQPDPGTYVLIDSNQNSDSLNSFFKPNTTGLIYNESYSGFGAIFLGNENLEVGMKCLVRLAQWALPMEAIVRWRENFDVGICKVGFEYIERED